MWNKYLFIAIHRPPVVLVLVALPVKSRSSLLCCVAVTPTVFRCVNASASPAATFKLSLGERRRRRRRGGPLSTATERVRRRRVVGRRRAVRSERWPHVTTAAGKGRKNAEHWRQSSTCCKTIFKQGLGWMNTGA